MARHYLCFLQTVFLCGDEKCGRPLAFGISGILLQCNNGHIRRPRPKTMQIKLYRDLARLERYFVLRRRHGHMPSVDVHNGTFYGALLIFASVPC